MNYSIVSFSVLGVVLALIVDAEGAIVAAAIDGAPVAVAAFVAARDEAARDAAAIVVEGYDPRDAAAIVVEAVEA